MTLKLLLLCSLSYETIFEDIYLVLEKALI